MKPLEEIDVTRMILNARKREDNIQTSFGLGYYRKIALLQPRTGEGILCHKCRLVIELGESFAKKSSRGKPYHIECAKQLHLI